VAVEAALPALVGSNEHVRDAAGCALWYLTPPKTKAKKTRNPTDPKPPRAPREPRLRAVKAEKPCGCARRHKRGCPHFVATTYKKGGAT
jgi:hypothetical protein